MGRRVGEAPAIGDWSSPEPLASASCHMIGCVVDVLPDGEQCILARRSPFGHSQEVIESVHNTADLLGVMTGKIVRGMQTWRPL